MLVTDGLFTSESVSEGHPDKICDQISDAILDACLAQDPASRVAVEAAIKGGTLCLLGELTSAAEIDAAAVARRVLAEIGHDGRWGLDPAALTVVQGLSRQSPEIAAALDGADIDRTDGLRVTTPDGWWLLRASGTEPKLTARVEAWDDAGLDRMRDALFERLRSAGLPV